MTSTVAWAALAAIGTSAPAWAQDVQVKIQIPVTEQVIREIRREVTRVIDVTQHADVVRHVERALHAAMPHIEVAAQQRGRFPAEAVHRETKTLAIGSSGSLDLRNHGGDITITAGTGKDAVVDIVRQARGRTDADAKRGLDEVTVAVDHRADRAIVQVVDTRPRNRENYSVSVSYTVAAPPGTRVNVSSLGATVRVTGIKGDVVIDVAGGDINITASRISRAKSMGGDIRITDVDSDGNVEIGTYGGDVVIERSKMRRLNAETMGGDLMARDVTAEEAALSSLAGNVEYGGGLLKNGRYELRTHSGTVRFIASGTTGFEIEATTFSGSVRPAADLGLKLLSQSQRGIRGVSGDGSARIIATALSGDVIIVKK